jgi:hypothetical protein
MKILVIEDEEVDFIDIRDCLPQNGNIDIVHKTNLKAVETSDLDSDFDLCITDIVEHKGKLNFGSQKFKRKFRCGIEKIAQIHQHLESGKFILITKIPATTLNENLPSFQGDHFVEALFPMLFIYKDGIKYDKSVLEKNKCSSFYLCNNGRVFTIAKPYNQDREFLTNLEPWKMKLRELIINITTEQKVSVLA